MSRIERYSNWCWIDRLEGVDLKDGERLLVRWPNSILQYVCCIVEQRTVDIQDMGNTFGALESFAYAEIDHHGVKARVPLVGMEAKRTTAAEDGKL
jgi:hypothetical protein